MSKQPSSQPKIRVGILFGGKSAEHEISIQSAKNVVSALDTEKFEPVLIGIDTQGSWHKLENPKTLASLTTMRSNSQHASSTQMLATIETDARQSVDVIFPILHGPLGEDGTIQGFLELAGTPYVGCGVLSSAIGMDKDVMKRLLRDAGIPITDFITLHRIQRQEVDYAAIIKKLGLPLFVKPANMGSSIGVSKVSSGAELPRAIDKAFKYDKKILLEKAVNGDEVECAVLGNDRPQVSVPGRIMTSADFYTYEAKYHDEDGTALEIPAKLPEAVAKNVQAIALKTFAVLGCEGMARVDMFVTQRGEVVMNEINTIPGFTRFSMYPQLWEASGISYTELITQLLELALRRFDQKKLLQTSYKIG